MKLASSATTSPALHVVPVVFGTMTKNDDARGLQEPTPIGWPGWLGKELIQNPEAKSASFEKNWFLENAISLLRAMIL